MTDRPTRFASRLVATPAVTAALVLCLPTGGGAAVGPFPPAPSSAEPAPPTSTFTTTPPSTAADRWKLLDRLLETVVGWNDGFGGGTFRVSQGSALPEPIVLWEGAAGDLTHGGAPMTPDAVFQIASTSKAFTAVAALALVQDGLLSLDQKTGDILPPELTAGLLVIDGHDYGPELTVRQMLSHTSGLPDYWYDPPYVIGHYNAFTIDYMREPQRFWEPEEILAYIPDMYPIFRPGEGWHYSDTGFVLVGLMMETVTGMELHEIYRRWIFDPLGLDATWLQWREPIETPRPQSHRYEGKWDMYDKRHQSADWAGGGLVSANTDLEAFLFALARGEIVTDPALRREMVHRTPTGVPGVDYGLGIFLVDLGDGQGEIWGHDGYGNSWMYYWPRQDVSFVGTLNQTENDWWALVKLAAILIDTTPGAGTDPTPPPDSEANALIGRSPFRGR